MIDYWISLARVLFMPVRQSEASMAKLSVNNLLLSAEYAGRGAGVGYSEVGIANNLSGVFSSKDFAVANMCWANSNQETMLFPA